MSESYPEPRSSGGGNILTRKLGPLPVWGWMGIGLVAAIGWYMIQKKKTPAATTAQSASSGTTDTSLIPQFVNQVYTNGRPPSGHNPRAGTTTTAPPTESGGSVIMSIPDGSGGWEQVSFPNQAAVDKWNAWNQAFVNDQHAQAYRSQWNTELTSLGVTRTNGQPLAPPSSVTGNPFDAL
jgi:hypothetical protein